MKTFSNIVFKVVISLVVITIGLNASSFNAQAEKDRLALKKYMESKFKNSYKNRYKFFPYSTKKELRKYPRNIKGNDFSKGNYAYNMDGRSQYEEIAEMPPYEDHIDAGENIYNKVSGLKKCFPNASNVVNNYPKFDTSKNEVVTLGVAINNCLDDNGHDKWKLSKGKMTDLQAYFAYNSQEENKKISVKIPNMEAQKAYEAGKKYFYSQRGYLNLSCANCHVQGAGKRVRREVLSPLYGAVTHFPVYRLKWGGLGSLERRMSGCIKDTGQQPPKNNSKDMRNLLYFMSYMSNGLKIDGPDVRK
jgi:sulfur-oxidizing protein SoxA